MNYDDAAIAEIYKKTKGYPYFVQEWGYNSWNEAASSPISIEDVKKASDISIKKLDESFFRVRFDRLTPREKDYLFAMVKLGSGTHRSGNISDCLNVTVESIAPVRRNLIKKGMIYSPSHGNTAFTVPMFDEYLNRIHKLK